MFVRRFCLVISWFALLSFAQSGTAQISKGNLILIDRGVQLQSLLTPDNYFHSDTYSNAGYTTIAFGFDTTGNLGPIETFTGDAPGLPWSRWASDETNMPGMGIGFIGGDPGRPYSRTNEIPHFSQLVAVQLGDEWNLNDDGWRTRLVNWFNATQTNWPNTILYHNSYGSQVGDAQLSDFTTRAHPDMLCFDTYPWQSVYDTNLPDHTGAPYGGPPTGWYGDLRRYREHARSAGIPLALYRQTFHAVQDYDGHIFRDPSPSELALETSVGLAFNAKFFTDFLYNAGAASLFTKTFNGSGDSVIATNGLYAEMADTNLRARNLGKALLRLKPIVNDLNTGFATTSIMFVRGKVLSGGVTNRTAIPVGFIGDQDTGGDNALYTDWVFARNDPYLSGFQAITNNGAKNNELAGDVIISWFQPLDNALLPTNVTNQIYMMVVNGLTDPTGTPAECLQTISLDFTFAGNGTNGVVLLNPTTGLLQTNAPLPTVNGKRRLTLTLNGGDAALFKFHDGTAFMGFVPPQAPHLTAQMQGGFPAIKVEGRVADRCRIESSTSPNTNWTTVTNLILPSSPYIFTDTTAAGSQRFYRAVAIP